MPDRVYKVVSQVLGVPVDKITDEDSPDTLRSWDSLTHISLILALEAEFDLSITPDDASEMISVGLIRNILRARGVEIFS